jgi:4-methylaminobutanoate oxidase (formaldehyde-forming)
VGLAMIDGLGEPTDAKFFENGEWEIEIADKRWPAFASMKPLYDPENKKIKG